MSQLNFVRQTLYDLKRKYGVLAILVKISGFGYNFATGRKTVAKTYHKIGKLIRMDSVVTKAILREGIVGPDKMSGVIKNDTVNFILDGRDVTVQIDLEDRIIVDAESYVIESMEKVSFGMGFLLKCRGVESDPIDFELGHSLTFVNTAVAEVL